MVNGSDFLDNDETQVSCHTCTTEIPLSEAVSSEGEDYMLYFCGLGCFARWYRQAYGRVYISDDGQP
jgi:hypothetical protein